MGYERHRQGCTIDTLDNCNCDMYASEPALRSVEDWYNAYQSPPVVDRSPINKVRAEDILDECKRILVERGRHYRNDDERNMRGIVEIFNLVTGRDLKPAEGWLFMTCLKLVRAGKDPEYKPDHYIDLANYAVLAAEERAA